MKKTLVALAVLATAGTAFAQNAVSLTGNFGAGVQRNVTLGTKGHIGITDGGLTFAGSEDLGSGLKAGFSLSSDFFRFGSGDVATTDVFLTLGGGFGVIKAGEWESLSAAWTGGNVAPISLPTDPYDTAGAGTAASALVQASSRAARIAYSTPSFGGFKAGLTLTDRQPPWGNPVAGPEITASLGASYTAGGLNAQLALKNLNLKDGNTYQLGGSYDFGMVKVGAGVDLAQRGAGNDDRLGYLASIAAPIGPVTVGATYMQSDLTGDPVSWAVGAEYAISKRTAINASAGKFQGDYFDGLRQGQARLKLVHNF